MDNRCLEAVHPRGSASVSHTTSRHYRDGADTKEASAPEIMHPDHKQITGVSGNGAGAELTSIFQRSRKAMPVFEGPPNICRNGECGRLVLVRSTFQHYCGECAWMSDLGVSQPRIHIIRALQRRRRTLTRVLLSRDNARLPFSVVTCILDHLMNDLGNLSPSPRWECILMRDGLPF